jgi:hypothetical protein
MSLAVRQTSLMPWLPIRAGRDHLAQFANKPPIDALAELIWNSLDAEADLVDVEIETKSLNTGDKELDFVSKVTVTDNGHGIEPRIATEAFPSLGDSWKKGLQGRSVHDKRALHGSLGRGRFYSYSLGHRVRWTSVSETEGGFQSIHIEGKQSRIDGFRCAPPEPASGPSGTTVVIEVQQGLNLPALLREDLPTQLAIRLAAHLLGNPDITVRVGGERVDPAPLIDGQLIEVSLDDLPPADLHGHETPVMTIVDWKDEVRRAPGVVLCNEGGASLIEVENSAPQGTVRSTGYLRWSGWAADGADLSLSQLQHPGVIDAGIQVLGSHVEARVGALAATIVATLKEEGAYPYDDEPRDPIGEAEREMFDLVAVTARHALRSGGRQQRALSARLLQLALRDRPDDLELILTQALNLTTEEREQLADMLRVSSLGAIVRAATEVTRRLDLLSTLTYLVYGEVAPQMREVDQLHPLVKDNVWLFGEAWRLSGSEMGLTAVLREVISKDTILEADLLHKGEPVLLPDGRRGRVDLLLQRTMYETGEVPSRLVVELKRPSVILGFAELNQIERYAQTLATHPAVGSSHSSFWLVGSDHKPEIEGRLAPTDREWGHIVSAPTYDVKVTTWGRIISSAEQRFQFYREQLNYNIGQVEAVARVRRRHKELLPPEVAPTA